MRKIFIRHLEEAEHRTAGVIQSDQPGMVEALLEGRKLVPGNADTKTKLLRG
jgi:hypothetical protein